MAHAFVRFRTIRCSKANTLTKLFHYIPDLYLKTPSNGTTIERNRIY